MPEIINTKIDSIKYFACGYCTNNLGLVFRDYPKEIRNFKAGVFLIKHRDQGYILYDTGYATDIYNNGIIGHIYNYLNPVSCKTDDEIKCQLEANDIACNDIKHIILSHLHPDHIGGLKFFKEALITMSGNSYQNYKNPKMGDLIFKKMLPKNFEDRLNVVDRFDYKYNDSYFENGYDMLNDGSIILKELNGHAKGQLGAYMPEVNIFLAADSCWGKDLIHMSSKMKIISRAIQNDYPEYITSLKQIKKMADDDIDIYFSHDEIKKLELVKR